MLSLNVRAVLVTIAGAAGGTAAICMLVYAVSLCKAYMFEQVAIDKCIDSGRAWNYEKGACDV